MNLAFANLFQNGAQGRDRTTDTAIFSRMLYQLSYLGTSGREAAWERRFIVRLACPVHHASPPGYAWRCPAPPLGYAWRGPASPVGCAWRGLDSPPGAGTHGGAGQRCGSGANSP